MIFPTLARCLGGFRLCCPHNVDEKDSENLDYFELTAAYAQQPDNINTYGTANLYHLRDINTTEGQV